MKERIEHEIEPLLNYVVLSSIKYIMLLAKFYIKVG